MNDPVALELSLDELLWLGSAFDVQAMPLLAEVVAGWPLEQIMERGQKGLARLRERGLAQVAPSTGLRLDRWPAALVEWLATAPVWFEGTRYLREAPPACAALFPGREAGLWVDCHLEEETFTLTLYASYDEALERALAWMPSPTSSSPASYPPMEFPSLETLRSALEKPFASPAALVARQNRS